MATFGEIVKIFTRLQLFRKLDVQSKKIYMLKLFGMKFPTIKSLSAHIYPPPPPPTQTGGSQRLRFLHPPLH